MSAEIGERSDFSTVGSSRVVDTGLGAPATKPLCSAPTRQGLPHPTTIRDSTSSKKQMKLMACLLSGNTMIQDGLLMPS